MTLNPFLANAPFLYLLKTSENLFWCFRGVGKGCIGNEWVQLISVVRSDNLEGKKVAELRKTYWQKAMGMDFFT